MLVVRDLCCDNRMSNNKPDALREVAEQVAAEAAAFARRRRDELVGIESQTLDSASVRAKSTRTDPVTVVDTETETLVRDRLAQLRPDDPILGEEGGGPSAGADDGVRWVVDPIDGTVNFVYGLPTYAVSVAAQVDGRSVAGAVVNVVTGEMYSAAIGLGAHSTVAGARRALHCGGVDQLSMALLGTGFGYAPRRRAQQAALLAQMLPLVRDVRRIGCASLDLCMVASGQLDAHYEHGLNVWDWAAGALVAAEAGASVLLPDAASPQDAGRLVVVSAPGIAEELIRALDRCGGLGELS